MRVVVTPGAWYQDARLDGQYIASVVGSHLDSAQGRIERPNGIDILFPRVPRLGPFKFSGQSSVTNGPNLEYLDGVFHKRLAHSYGVNPVIYRNNGTLLENDVGLGYGSQGFRFIDDPIGRVWTGDETYADPARRFWEWTRLYGYTAGRVPVTNATDRIVIELPDGERRMIADVGRYLPNSIHYDTDGVDHVICYTDELTQKGYILWFTTLELVTQFPLEPTTEPEPEPERPTCTIVSYPDHIVEGDPCGGIL